MFYCCFSEHIFFNLGELQAFLFEWKWLGAQPRSFNAGCWEQSCAHFCKNELKINLSNFLLPLLFVTAAQSLSAPHKCGLTELQILRSDNTEVLCSDPELRAVQNSLHSLGPDGRMSEQGRAASLEQKGEREVRPVQTAAEQPDL